MKHGHFQVCTSKMLFFGTAGVGKTCTKDVMTGFKPPEVRQSTPLSTRPVTLYQFYASKEIWKTFTSDNNMKFCARIAKSLRPEVQQVVLEADWSTDFDSSTGPELLMTLLTILWNHNTRIDQQLQIANRSESILLQTCQYQKSSH